VESGEGIESLYASLVGKRSLLPWNPVKELKDDLKRIMPRPETIEGGIR